MTHANLEFQNIKEGIEGHGVSWYSEVFDLVFPDLDNDVANNIWKSQLAESPSANKSQEQEQDD